MEDFGKKGTSHSEEELVDLEEDQVWDVMTKKEVSSVLTKSRKKSSSSSAWRFNGSNPRAVPKSNSGGGSSGGSGKSAPMEIPDWSKILKKKPKRNLWDDACKNDGDFEDHVRRNAAAAFVDDGDISGDDEEMIPPHEYLAKRLASTQINSSFSMCEGVGRTLKGRDLSRLRNAILTKTGFLE